MAKNLHPPEKLLSGNLKENFRKFIQQFMNSFMIYLTAAGITRSTEDVKCATLLHVISCLNQIF